MVAPLNIGLVDASRRTPDMPLYTLRNKTTREIVQVTDPGRALIDGKWSHIGRFKGPMLQPRPPRPVLPQRLRRRPECSGGLL